jgi:hypothetical protein
VAALCSRPDAFRDYADAARRSNTKSLTANRFETAINRHFSDDYKYREIKLTL